MIKYPYYLLIIIYLYIDLFIYTINYQFNIIVIIYGISFFIYISKTFL